MDKKLIVASMLVFVIAPCLAIAQNEFPLQSEAVKPVESQAPKHATLSIPGLGMDIPIIISPDDLDAHVGHVIAIRGSISNTKIPEIIGVYVSGGHKLPDACAVGILVKVVTTKKEWKEQEKMAPYGMGAGSFGPGTRYSLYKDLEGHWANAQAWGTGYTENKENKENISPPPRTRNNK